MDVSAKNTKLWRKDIEGRNGVFHRYSIGIGKKMEDGSYANAYIPVIFAKKAEAPEDIPNGALCSIEGFMSVDSYTDKNDKTRNVPQIVVTSIEFNDPTIGVDSFEQAEDEIPF